MKARTPSLAKNSIFNMVYNILNLLFPLVTSMYVSRVLLPEGVGKVAFARNIVSYFIVLAALGLPAYGIREIAKSRVKGDRTNLNRTFTQLLCINWITTGISAAAFFILLGADFFRADTTLMLCCSIELIFCFINIDWFYQGMEEYVYIVCRSVVIKVISILSIFLFVRDRDDFLIYALITSLAMAGNYSFNIIHARKLVKLDFTDFHLAQHWKPLIILGVAVFFSTIYSRLDITMLGMMYSESETGLYANAFKLVTIVTSVCSSVSAVFLPRLSLYFQNDRLEFDKLINYGVEILSFFAFPLVVGLMVLAPQAVSLLFGDRFLGSVPIIRILAILVIIKAFGDLLCYQLCIATGHEKDRLPAYIAASGLNILMNYLLIPVIGGVGAAAASVCSELLLNAVQFFKMKRLLQYRLQIRPILQGALSALVMGAGVILVLPLMSNPLGQCVAGTLTGCVLYILLNIAGKNQVCANVIGALRSKLTHK